MKKKLREKTYDELMLESDPKSNLSVLYTQPELFIKTMTDKFHINSNDLMSYMNSDYVITTD